MIAEKDKWNFNQFGELSSIEHLNEYLVREYRHTEYVHYTKLGVLDSILKSKSFWVSPVTEFNDKKDTEQFDEGRRYYSLCFSTGTNENLALWYLYSGMDGKGAAISFDKKQIKKVVETTEYLLYECDNDKKPIRKICALNKENSEIKFKDVLYFKNERNEKMFLKYNTMTNKKIKRN